MSEMSTTFKEIAKNAQETAEITRSAVELANTVTHIIANLGRSGNEIGNVIKVITSIADQTNLLALNATIEAARAGDAGKGFAVVANEVKDLARETANATVDISGKIESIQRDTQGAIKAVNDITEVVNQINDRSSVIAGSVEQQTATANEISRGIGEAAQGNTEVTESIIGVAASIEDTSKGAADSQTAAESLNKMAVELQNLVDQFKC